MGNNSQYKVSLTMKRKSKEREEQIVNILAQRMFDSLVEKQAVMNSKQGKQQSTLIDSKKIG